MEETSHPKDFYDVVKPEIRAGKDAEKRPGVLRKDNHMSLQCVVIDRSGATTRSQLKDQPKRVAPCSEKAFSHGHGVLNPLHMLSFK